MKVMTHEEFVSRVKIVLGDEYEVLGKYVNQGTEIEIKHTVCGCIRSVKPREVLRTKKDQNGKRVPNPTKCPHCYGNSPHTIEEFKEIIRLANINENLKLEVLDNEYKGNKIGIKTLCHKCNTIFYPSWNSFVNKGNRCQCENNHIIPDKKKMTIDDFKNIVHDIDDSYVVLSNTLESYYLPVRMKHLECGSEYNITPDNFINSNRRCKECANKKRRVSLADFKEMVYKEEENNYTVLQDKEPLNNKEPILIRHNCDKCNNHEFSISIVNFRNGHRCPICAFQQESKGELELRNYVESMVECHDKFYSKSILDGKEIDILTKNNIGFEYNGEYWHQEGVNLPIGYHKDKTMKAKEKGIILYHIWERNWINRQEEVKEFIKKALEKGD